MGQTSTNPNASQADSQFSMGHTLYNANPFATDGSFPYISSDGQVAHPSITQNGDSDNIEIKSPILI
jgi:hypothetical protein